MYMLLFSYALLRYIFVQEDKLAESCIKAFKKPCKILLQGKRKHKNLFNYWQNFGNFYPYKDIIIKKVLKLRSIAKLVAFDGSILFLVTNL